MKNARRVIWGVILIAVAVLFALKALEIVKIDGLFRGWWTLFIIVPCGIGLFTEREKTGNLIGLIIGLLLLLKSREILPGFVDIWKLILCAVVLVVGLNMLLTGLFGKTEKEIVRLTKERVERERKGCAVFSGCDMRLGGEVFEGADLLAVFGGVECDLRDAIIEKDCVIRASVVFGGIDILTPSNVNVKVDSVCIFGGFSNKKPLIPDAPTIYVSGVTAFGGVDIK